MTGRASRRGFLRGLTTLPLIGGGVTLVGVPTAVAEPVTDTLLREYHDWLMYERYKLVREISGEDEPRPEAVDASFGAAWMWHRRLPDWYTPPPSTRAALVLSAVGCPWG